MPPKKLTATMHIKPSPTSRTSTLTTGASWRTTAITAALGVLLSTAHMNTQAMALGSMTSLSALGEPLVAGIAVPEINPEEFSSLKVTVATPEEFKAAGMEYNAALTSAQITLQRRPDGTIYLLLRSSKVVADPFVNVVVTASWAGGKIVRNYTLLLDPPAARQNETGTVAAPLTAMPPTPAPVSPLPVPKSEASAPVAAPAAVARPIPDVKPIPLQTAQPSSPASPSPAIASKNSGEQIKVASGDTAGKIAANNRPNNVSLDQMLMAMLRGNPDAFAGNNINRLKSGAILSLPTSEEAQAIPEDTARQNLLAQSKDFNSFRRKLAENAPSIASKAPDRQTGGKVEAKVEDRKTPVETPDKLTLSKGNLNTDPKAAASKETKDNSEKIAKERQAKDDAARVAELSKNISDLNKIAGATPVAPAKPMAANAPTPASAAAATSTAVAVAAPAALVAATTATAPTTVPAAAPATAAIKPVVPATPPTKPVAMAQAPVPEPSFLDGLMDDPAVLPAAGGLLALLAAGGLYVANKRKKSRAEAEEYDFDGEAQTETEIEVDPKFEEQPFFNTANHEAVAQPPVLAEPVLSSAPAPADEPAFTSPRMSDIPDVTEIPVATVESAAPEPVMALPVMPVIAAVAPSQSATAEDHDNYPEFTPSEFSTRTVAQIDPESAKSPASVDLDLDFDFASDFPGMQARNPIIAQVKPMSAPPAPHLHTLDFELPIVSKLAALAAAAPSANVKPLAPATAPVDTVVNLAAPLEFNLDDLSLDLNAGNQSASKSSTADAVGPLETKLALAQEFRAIGDTMGAKMLAQEVIAMASGSLKTKAETLLAEIG